MQKNKVDVRYLTRLALMVAILLVMYYTPLGMLPTPGQSVTLLTVPVAVGGMILGPAAGGVLGFTFGMLSFWRAFQTGTLLAAGVAPAAIFVLCVVTRTCMGVLAALIYRLTDRIDPTHTVSCFVGGAAAPLLNTLFYMTAYVVILLNTPLLQAVLSETLLETLRDNVLLFVAAYVGVQALVEAGVGCVVSGLVANALRRALKHH